MNEAYSVIEDFKKESLVYGSSVILRRVTQGEPDLFTGERIDTIVDKKVKAFPKRQSTEATQRAFLSDYEISFLMYLDFIPLKTDKIIFNGDEYNIVYIAPMILQDVIIKYEILAKK